MSFFVLYFAIVLKELSAFHIGIKDMEIFHHPVIFCKKMHRSLFFNISSI